MVPSLPKSVKQYWCWPRNMVIGPIQTEMSEDVGIKRNPPLGTCRSTYNNTKSKIAVWTRYNSYGTNSMPPNTTLAQN